jgi:hypothetical protein
LFSIIYKEDKMLKKILLIALICLPCISYGCVNDYDCGVGNKCVQPNDAVNQFQGICVTPTDNGVPQPYVPDGSIQPHQVQGCDFDTDCDPGYSCIKRAGELSGVCAR